VDPEDIKPLFDRLRAHGVRVAKPGGGMFPEGDVEPGNTIFTHPRDTYGQLEFEGIFEHWLGADPRFSPGWTTEPWSTHPLGIVRASHLSVVVGDLAGATDLFVSVLDGTVCHRETSEEDERIYVAVGTDTLVALVEPATAESRAGRDRRDNGDVPHECTFTVRDLASAERHVEQVGVGIIDRRSDGFTLDPADSFGALYSFTERVIPGDPRVP
jgi:hypothetical protein